MKRYKYKIFEMAFDKKNYEKFIEIKFHLVTAHFIKLLLLSNIGKKFHKDIPQFCKQYHESWSKSIHNHITILINSIIGDSLKSGSKQKIYEDKLENIPLFVDNEFEDIIIKSISLLPDKIKKIITINILNYMNEQLPRERKWFHELYEFFLKLKPNKNESSVSVEEALQLADALMNKFINYTE